jgi:hypothetical protein
LHVFDRAEASKNSPYRREALKRGSHSRAYILARLDRDGRAVPDRGASSGCVIRRVIKCNIRCNIWRRRSPIYCADLFRLRGSGLTATIGIAAAIHGDREVIQEHFAIAQKARHFGGTAPGRRPITQLARFRPI